MNNIIIDALSETVKVKNNCVTSVVQPALTHFLFKRLSATLFVKSPIKLKCDCQRFRKIVTDNTFVIKTSLVFFRLGM